MPPRKSIVAPLNQAVSSRVSRETKRATSSSVHMRPAGIISACTYEVHLALGALEQNKGVAAHSIEINRLENEADRIHQQAVVRLFDEETNPIVVIKWKEALDFLEQATDRCEDVANVLEGVVVKHA